MNLKSKYIPTLLLSACLLFFLNMTSWAQSPVDGTAVMLQQNAQGNEKDRNGLILWFGLGVLAQALLLIKNDFNWIKLGSALGVGLLGFMPGKHETDYNLLFHVFMAFCFFAFMFAIVYKEDLLPLITEKVLLSYTLIFWYSFFSFFYKGEWLHKALFFFFLAPSLAAVVIAFIKTKLNFWGKLFFYTWFLVIIMALGLFRFSFDHLSLFFGKHFGPWLGPVDCGLTGMAFLYLIINATYIWELIPIPGKNQSWESRMKEWHDLTNLMTQRCDDTQPNHLQTILILLLQGGGLYINYLYHFIQPQILINILILLPTALSNNYNTTKLALQSNAAMSTEI